jgi:hypothetical protein
MTRVSKKTRSRRGAPAGRAPGNEPPANAGRRVRNPGDAVDAVVSRLLTTIAAGDLLRAELETAAIMAIPHAMGKADPDDVKAFVSDVLVGGAVRTRTPESAALLRLLMSLGSPAVKRESSQALARLTSAGVYPPAAVTEIGKAVPVRAWRRYDVFGDDETVAVTFGYGGAEHGIAAHIDLAGLPIAAVVGIALDPAKLIEVMDSEDDPFERQEQIGLAEARRRLEDPLTRCDQDPDPGTSADTLAYLPIARSRIRRLPVTGPGAEAPVFTAADRAAAVHDFLRSPLAAEAVAADEESTRFWAEVLTGYSSRTSGEPPAQVGPRKLAHVLLGHVPNTFTLSPAQRQHLEPAVTAWTRWSAAYRDLDEAQTARLVKHLPDTLARFADAYDDPDAVVARSYLTDLAASDSDVTWLVGQLARRMFAVPMPEPSDHDGRLDAGDPADRRAFAERRFAACAPPGGMTSEQFVSAADQVISELWHDDPPETFRAARRLDADGADWHDIIHTLVEAKESPAARRATQT